MSMMDKEGVIKLNTKSLVAWLLVVGAINWGLVGLLGMDLVANLLGGTSSLLAKVVYIVIGLAGVYKAYMLVTKSK